MTTTPTPTTSTDAEWRTSEYVAKQMLALVADHPGRVRPLRAARIVGGFTVPYTTVDEQKLFEQYAIPKLDWPIRTLKDLLDALERGGLVARSVGQRPTLALTRAGHRALETLELDGSASC